MSRNDYNAACSLQSVPTAIATASPAMYATLKLKQTAFKIRSTRQEPESSFSMRHLLCPRPSWLRLLGQLHLLPGFLLDYSNRKNLASSFVFVVLCRFCSGHIPGNAVWRGDSGLHETRWSSPLAKALFSSLELISPLRNHGGQSLHMLCIQHTVFYKLALSD